MNHWIKANPKIFPPAASAGPGRSFRAPSATPPRWKTAIVTWVAVYPTITGLLLVAGQHLEMLSIAVKTLILTSILVPLMTFILMPMMTWILRGWLVAADHPAHSRQEVPCAKLG
ncbi:MAG: hypothetical protein AAF560_24890 [Acidobacteriota bacterium]